MGNCQGWLHLDRFNKIIILFRMIFRMMFRFLFHFIPYPDSNQLIFSKTHVPTVPTVPERHLHRKKATKAHEDEHCLCSPRAILFPIPHPSSNSGSALILIEGDCSCQSCCMTKGVRMFLALLPLIKSRLTGNVPRASPLLLCVNVELNLQFGCAEYRTLDTRGLGACCLCAGTVRCSLIQIIVLSWQLSTPQWS